MLWFAVGAAAVAGAAAAGAACAGVAARKLRLDRKTRDQQARGFGRGARAGERSVGRPLRHGEAEGAPSLSGAGSIGWRTERTRYRLRLDGTPAQKLHLRLEHGELLALGLERARLDVPERLQLRRFKLLRRRISRVGTDAPI